MQTMLISVGNMCVLQVIYINLFVLFPSFDAVMWCYPITWATTVSHGSGLYEMGPGGWDRQETGRKKDIRRNDIRRNDAAEAGDLPDGSSAKRSKQGDYTMRDGFLRVAAATPEVKVADVQFNREGDLPADRRGREKKAKIMVFPGALSDCLHLWDLFIQKFLRRL